MSDIFYPSLESLNFVKQSITEKIINVNYQNALLTTKLNCVKLCFVERNEKTKERGLVMDNNLQVAGVKLNSYERERLEKLAKRINGSRSDVLKAFINYFTEDELAKRMSEVLLDPKGLPVTA